MFLHCGCPGRELCCEIIALDFVTLADQAHKRLDRLSKELRQPKNTPPALTWFRSKISEYATGIANTRLTGDTKQVQRKAIECYALIIRWLDETEQQKALEDALQLLKAKENQPALRETVVRNLFPVIINHIEGNAVLRECKEILDGARAPVPTEPETITAVYSTLANVLVTPAKIGSRQLISLLEYAIPVPHLAIADAPWFMLWERAVNFHLNRHERARRNNPPILRRTQTSVT